MVRLDTACEQLCWLHDVFADSCFAKRLQRDMTTQSSIVRFQVINKDLFLEYYRVFYLAAVLH